MLQKKGSGEWNPLIYAIIIILMFGAILPYVVSSFVDIPSYNSVFYGLGTFVQNGVSIEADSFVGSLFDFFGWDKTIYTFNLFNWFPSIKSFLVTYITALTYIPNIIAIPIFVFIAVCLIYTILRLARG